MALITTDDLKEHALWLSGEPTNGTSDYELKVMDHMQTVYNTLTNGGTLGSRDLATSAGLYEHVVDIPSTDWLWLRQYPPFAFNTTPAILQVGTVTLTNDSTTITFSDPPTVSVAGWRLKLQDQAAGVIQPPITVPRIDAHVANAANATLDAAWPQTSQTAGDYVVFQAEYDMPENFVRFVEAPMVHGGWLGEQPPRLNIGSAEQIFDRYPLQEIAQGPPTAAARIATTTLMLNRWDTQSYRIEYSYIFTPPVLVAGATPDPQEPLVPVRYRQVLSIGAAMLVLLDKSDSRSAATASQCREIVAHMGNEYRKEQNAGSELAGRHLYRWGANGRRGVLRTSSGLPLF